MSDSNDTSNNEAELAAAEVAAILAAAPSTGASSSAESASVPAPAADQPSLTNRESSSNNSLSSMPTDADQRDALSALTALGDVASNTLRAQTAAANQDEDDEEEEEGAINEDDEEEEEGAQDVEDEDDEDEDEEMADAVEPSVPGGAALAPTNSGMGSSTTSLSDVDSLSVLSSPSSEAGSLPDEEDGQVGPSAGSSDQQQGEQGTNDANAQAGGQQSSYDDDEQEEEGEVPDDEQDTPRQRSPERIKSGENRDDKGSDYGDSESSLSNFSDVSSEGGRDDGYDAAYNRGGARRASGSAAMMTESPGGTPQLDDDEEDGPEGSPAVRGDLSGSDMGGDEEDEEDREQEEEEEEEGAIGSPASNAETEPLPFDDAQQPAPGAGEGEEEAEEEGQQEEPTAAAGALAEAAKDDREEVATATPQEAMEALARIELQFAMLRDRRYMERMEEICRESEMVLDGTHPELIRFTKAIDQLKERKLRLLDMELQKQVAHYEQVGEGEEQVIWNSYRYQAADLRQNMMDDTARKRRRLEREKRLIDAPRPARRHQTFETELVPNPDRQYSAALRARKRDLAIADATAAATSLSQSNPEAARKAAALVQRLQENAVEEDANDYVAYPEVKGLDEAELWTDLDRMGILGYGGPGGPLQHYYAEEMQAAGLDDRAGPSTEVAGGPEAGYPYAPTEASLHGYPVPDHESVGGGAGPSYNHHGRGDRQMPDEYGPRGGPQGGEVWPGHFAGHGGGPGPGSMEAWQAQQQQLQHHQLSPPPQQQPQPSSRQHPNSRMGPPPQMQYRSHMPPIPADGGMEQDRMRGVDWSWT